jgi:hypothetical protein
MPKVTGTRKDKAAKLKGLVERGPSLTDNYDGSPYSADQAKADIKLWLSSWVQPLIEELVPELRKRDKKEDLI